MKQTNELSPKVNFEYGGQHCHTATKTNCPAGQSFEVRTQG